MSNKLISIIAVVVVIIGVGIFLIKGRPASAPSVESPAAEVAKDTVEASPSTNVAAPGTLQALLKSGIAQKCTFSETTEGGVSQGVFYIDNGKARGDFDVVMGEQTTKSHMIVDGQVSYIWSDRLATGVKVTITASPTPGVENTSQQFDMNKTVNYQCGAWMADSTLFVPPSTVTFSDMSDLMPNLSGATQSTDSKCATCDSAPAASRAECRAALGCK